MQVFIGISAVLISLTLGFATPAKAEDGPLAKELAEKAQGAGKAPADVKKVMNDATEEIRRSTILSTAAKVGDKISDFELPGPDGKPVSSAKILAEGPMVMTFYRGGWCPFCNLQLNAYQKALPEFRKRQASIVAISPETPDNAATTLAKAKADFKIATDAGNAYAKKLGLVFHVNDDLKRVYQGFGIDLAKSQGNQDWDLPVPATYVVDRKGVIRWAFVDVDYKKRAEPADILKALDELAAKSM